MPTDIPSHPGLFGSRPKDWRETEAVFPVLCSWLVALWAVELSTVVMAVSANAGALDTINQVLLFTC